MSDERCRQRYTPVGQSADRMPAWAGAPKSAGGKRTDGRLPKATLAALQACAILWAARDVHEVVEAATGLVHTLVPGTEIRSCDTSIGEGADTEPSRGALQVVLEKHRSLIVAPPEGADDGERSALAVAVRLIEMHVHALAREARFEDSVARLSWYERLQAALFHITERAATVGAIEDLYCVVHRAVGELLDARNFYVALLSKDGSRLTFPYWVNEYRRRAEPRRLGRGMTEYVLRKTCPVRVDEDGLARLDAAGEVQSTDDLTTAWLGIPLVCDTRTVGVLAVQSYEPGFRYERHDQEVLSFAAYQIASASARVRAQASVRRMLSRLETEVDRRTRQLSLINRRLLSEIEQHKRSEARLARAATRDALTDLPNQTYFKQRLARAFRRYRSNHGLGFAVLFVDLDHFKIINDSEGHAVGDDALVKVGARLCACVKRRDVVARLGGDEFGILLEGVGDRSRARRVAERIMKDLRMPFRLSGKDALVSIYASVGVALAHPRYSRFDELLRDADAAMYRAKADGRDRCTVLEA